jgi:hypothetical protein
MLTGVVGLGFGFVVGLGFGLVGMLDIAPGRGLNGISACLFRG